ncbi:MAG: hypothetical protein LBL87_05155 [Ruminococcus sp.]|nr:hypothetical protein [Ruminococcus sp.]
MKHNESLIESKNAYDWLGNGIYFWEQNLERAWDWAKEHKKTPAVIGAVIDLGNCLNLCDKHCIDVLKNQYEYLKDVQEKFNVTLPKNVNVKNNSDLLLRYLDCAVIETLHRFNSHKGQPEYDSVRGVFLEGDPIYENSGFRSKTHIQICVRNPNCIKGMFLPRAKAEDSNWDIP